MSNVHKKTHRILLVGRDKLQLNELSEHLDLPTVECESALDITTAEKALSCRCLDVMVLDSTLPTPPHRKKMKDTIEGLKSSFNTTKIVVFNGVSNRTLQRRIRRCGADGYLSSKNNMKRVAGSVRKLLGI